MICWYVHHHGWGHLARMRAIRPHLREDVTVFSSLPRPSSLPERTTWVSLPSDSDPVITPNGVRRAANELGDVTARGILHWAPIAHPGHRARLAAMGASLAQSDVSAFVVDVSVEVAVLSRLFGVPTVAVAQPGDRVDAPHRLGYDIADLILAPWAPGTIEAVGLAGREARVRRVGGVSRFDGRSRGVSREKDRVLFLGRSLDPSRLAKTVALLEERGWVVDFAGTDVSNRVDDVWPLVCRAEVVVSAAGQNSVADLAAANARAVFIAQERPFREQEHTAHVLAARGWAHTASAQASPTEIADLIPQARHTTPSWDAWGVTGAASRAAAVISEVAR